MSSSPGSPAGLRWFGLPPRIALGFGVALVSVVAAAGATYASLQARAAASLLVRHTAVARLAIEELESALLVSSASLEAWVTTRDPRQLARSGLAASKVRPAVASLQGISEQHPEEKPRIAQLAAELDAVRAEHDHVFALVAADDAEAARALLARGAGAEALERATAVLEHIEEDEARAHAGREEAWSRSIRVSHAIVLSALCVLLMLMLRAARLVRDEIRLREAEAAERERALVVQRRLMAVVSHDLRNPLTGILAAAWTLTRGQLAPEVASAGRRIVSAGRRMERLIRDVLDWSRMHGGATLPIARRDADLHDVCRRIADELSSREDVRIRVEHDGDTRGLFDPDRIEQVVGNLLSNALRHAPPGSEVLVRASGTPDDVRVAVQDEGPGIPPDAWTTIFEPFQQGPANRGTGVGLGLFIVRALVEAHGGAIEFESSPGKTTFAVRLPRRAP